MVDVCQPRRHSFTSCHKAVSVAACSTFLGEGELPLRPDRAGHRVARDIAHRIIKSGWPVGAHLGTEAALMNELGVGRATFREGVGILQRQGVIQTVAGPKGGLIVKAPPEAAFSNLLRNHLELTDVSFDELMLVHKILFHIAADLALSRVTPARLNDLRAAMRMPGEGRLTRDEQGMQVTAFEAAMLRMADNPDLGHITLAVQRLLADFGHQERYPKAVWQEMLARTYDMNARMLAALVARDARIHDVIDERYEYVTGVIEQLERRNGKVWNRKSFLHGAYTSALIGREREQRAPLQLSYQLAAQIRRNELPPGTSLGNEDDIALFYDASKVVVIEAVRMLEFLGIVRVSRGRSAGVEVIEPDPSLVIQTAELYLEYLNGLPADLEVVRRGIERGAIASAAGNLLDSAISPLVVRATRLAELPDNRQLEEAADLYRRILSLSGNRALNFLAEILSKVHRKQGLAARSEPGAIARAANDLALALADPDGRDVARCMIELVGVLDLYIRAGSASDGGTM